jgi:S-adenosylmethionine:tRNA ribosyltransferase-isomerase
MNEEQGTIDSDLLLSSYDYDLPEELIAAYPVEVRDASRLMVVRREGGGAVHAVFRDLTRYLRAGDLLVFNTTRVIPARLMGRREPGGGAAEVLLLHPLATEADGKPRWTALVRPGKKLKPGARIVFSSELGATVDPDHMDGGERALRFDCEGDLRAAIERLGTMPLPPYILARRGERVARPEDAARYQTVYAETDGSVAAPTAGLHFTDELLARIDAMGVERAEVILHVGLGTFLPITAERVDEHPIHTEEYEIPARTAEMIARAHREGRRVIAVGTTTVRALEDAATTHGSLNACTGEARLMIFPGYQFKAIDGLITNFHLPRSTLLCLVSALIGRERLLGLYEEAIREQYRFYSYGDAMVILPG